MQTGVSASNRRDAHTTDVTPLPAGARSARPAGLRRDAFFRGLRRAVFAMLAVLCAAQPAPAQPRDNASYFVDFRSRPGYLFGHTFIVYGQLDGRGHPFNTQLAGVYPLDGQSGLIMGSVLPVPASVRAVHGDYQERPTNIYRKRLSAAQYARLRHVVGRLRKSEREWNLLFKNCNDFAIEVAKGMGMTSPPSWLMPYFFVGELRLLNGP